MIVEASECSPPYLFDITDLVAVPIAGCLACEFLSSGSYILYIMNGVHYLALTSERWEPRWNHLFLVGGRQGGYSSGSVRHYLRERGIAALIPTKADHSPQPAFDRVAYRERNVVERLINRLKQFRRLATRYEKRAANYKATVMVAAILLWL